MKHASTLRSPRRSPVFRLAAATATGRLAAVAVFVLAAAAAHSGRAASTPASPASDPAVELDAFVVSATRSAQDARTLPSHVTLLPSADLAAAQVDGLRGALAQQPGVVVVNSGATGAQSSILLRGASSHQTLFFVDGVRMNDRSAAYFNFLGGAGLDGLDRIEVLRGPQGTLYGSSAMGGVVVLDTARPRDGTASGHVRAGFGSFDTRTASVAARGAIGTLDYSAAVSRHETDNDRPGNEFKSWDYSGRLEFSPAENLLVGATVRGQVSEYNEPGATTFPFPGVVDSRNVLVTTYGEWQPADGLRSRLTFGAHRRDYDFASDFGVSISRNARDIVEWTTTWVPTPRTEIVAGANYERSRFTVQGDTSRDRTFAGFVSATQRVTDEVTVIGGLRRDDFDSVGGATTWRTGVSWQAGSATRLRATYGTGFSAPGTDDRYGVPWWGQVPNPDIRPEESRGWDVGVEQVFAAARSAVSVTWFENRFTNLFEWETIDFETFEGRIVNRARATTSGVELALSASPVSAVRARLAYTWLEAENDGTGERLARRPRHTIDAEVQVQATEAVVAGVGLHGVADRVEPFTTAEDYITVRVFAAWRATKELTARVRIENAFDAGYAEVPGYPALPIGIFGGLEWAF